MVAAMERTYNNDVVCIKRAIQSVLLSNCFRWIMEYDHQRAMFHEIFSDVSISARSVLLQDLNLRSKDLVLERLGDPRSMNRQLCHLELVEPFTRLPGAQNIG